MDIHSTKKYILMLLGMLAALPIWPRVLITMLSGALVFSISYVYIVSPVMQKEEILIADRVHLKQQLDQAIAKNNTLPLLRNQIETLLEQYTFLLEKLPEDKNISTLVNEISKITYDNNLIIKTFKTNQPINKGSYNLVNILLSVKGTYAQLTNLILGATQLDRIIMIKDFQIIKNDNDITIPPLLDIRIALQTYVIKKNNKESLV